MPSWLVDHNNELSFVFSNAHEKVPNKIKFYLYMGGFPHCNLHLWFLRSLQYSFTGVYEPGIFQMFISEDRHTAVCTFTSDMPHSFMPLKHDQLCSTHHERLLFWPQLSPTVCLGLIYLSCQNINCTYMHEIALSFTSWSMSAATSLARVQE